VHEGHCDNHGSVKLAETSGQKRSVAGG
jgi:hypothetical protein